MVSDRAGDSFLVRTQDVAGVHGPPEPALDIIAVDVTADTKEIVATMLVEDLSVPVSAPFGSFVDMSFKVFGVDGITFGAIAMRDRFGNGTFWAYAIDGDGQFKGGGRAAGGFYDETDTIRVRIPVTMFARFATFSRGVRLEVGGLEHTTARIADPTDLFGYTVYADVATADAASYTIGTGAKTCGKAPA